MMRSLGWKFLMMGVLVFMLGAPLIAIHGLVGVRQETRDAAVQEIARGTGRAQTIVGPMLVVPVLRTVQDREIVENRYVLPWCHHVEGALHLAGPQRCRRASWQALACHRSQRRPWHRQGCFGAGRWPGAAG